MIDQKAHWDNVYQSKQSHEVSWVQEIPQASLKIIQEFRLPKDAAIIDVGGGDSKLVDHLLDEGYENITVLDISAKAIDRTRKRLGRQAEKVTWIVTDIMHFKPSQQYDLWHDRATFHFLTEEEQVESYTSLLKNFVNRYVVIGTFSKNGPSECSGLIVRRYNEEGLSQVIPDEFVIITGFTEDHITPSNATQNFQFCGFKRTK